MPRNLPLIVLVTLVSAPPLLAQYGSSTPPGGLAGGRVQMGDAVRQQQQTARWQLGPIELDPRLSIGDLGYVSNIYSTSEREAESDFSAGADAGLRGFLNLGPKVLLSPFASLSYAWWQEQTELRSLNESFGLQLFGDFNRLQLELEAGRVENQRNLSSEVEVPVDLRHDRARLGFEIDFWGPFSMFGSVSENRLRLFGEPAEQRVPGLDLSALAVDTEAVNGGLAYEFPNGLRLGLGVERTEATFLDDPGGRSNKGTALLLRAAIQGPRLSIAVDAARRELEVRGRQDGGERRQVTGFAQIGWKLTETLSTRVYQGLQLQPSAVDVDAFREDQRTGISLQRQAGPRALTGIFYETGEDEFAQVGDDRRTRLDEVTSYGLNLQVKLTARLTVELGVLDTRRESSDPAFDRSLTAVTSRVSLGGDLLPW